MTAKPTLQLRCWNEMTTAHGERVCELLANHPGWHSDFHFSWDEIGDLVAYTQRLAIGQGWAFKLPDNTLANYTESQSTVLFKDEVEASQAFGKQPGKAVRVKVIEVGPDLSGDGIKVGE